VSIKFNPLIFSGLDFSGGGAAGAVQWKSPVPDEASLPLVGNLPGDARVVLDTDKIYVWDDTTSKWIDSKLTATAFGSTPNADGITIGSITVGDITRSTINLEPADATNPGAVSISAQTFAGEKTFDDNLIGNGTGTFEQQLFTRNGSLNGSSNSSGGISYLDSAGLGIEQYDSDYLSGSANYVWGSYLNSNGNTTGLVGFNATDTNYQDVKIQSDNTVIRVSSTPGDDGVLDVGLINYNNGSESSRLKIGFTNSPEAGMTNFDSRGGFTFDLAGYNPTVASPSFNIKNNAFGSSPDANLKIQVVNDTNFKITSSTDLELEAASQIKSNSELSMESSKIVNLADGTNLTDAINLGQLEAVTTDIFAVTNEPTGFPNRTDSVISFNDLTREFTIAPVGASFDFYLKGQKFTKTTSQIITLPNLPGDHYIYFDATGSLTSTQSFSSDIITLNAIVSIVYWNTDTNKHTYFGEERHGLTMDGVTHAYLHTVFGARYLSGLALQGFTIGSGGSNADAQFTSDQGSIRDEDILHIIPAQAQIPILYRQGQLWRKKAADAYPVIYSGSAGYTGANGRLPYNQYTGGAWQLTQIGNSEYVLVHFFGTNDKDNPVVGVQGINVYNSAASARIGANVEISSLSGMPFAEFVPIGSVIFESANSFGNAIKARVYPTDTGADYVDFRGTQLYTPAGEATTHGLLSGLSNDDHFQYLLADGTRSMSGALDMGTHQINNVVDGVANDDAATVGQLNTAITGTNSFFAGFDSITGVLTEVPGYTFDDIGSFQIGAQNSITIPSGTDDYISISISPTVANVGIDNLTGVQLNSPINEVVTNYHGFQVFGYGTQAPENFTGYLSQPGYSETTVNVTHFSASGSANSTANLTGFSMTSGSDADVINGVDIACNGDATSVTGIRIVPGGAYTDTTGIKVDLSSATSVNRPVGLDITQGSISSNISFTTEPSNPNIVDSGNIIRPIFTVEASSPITETDVLMNNLAGFMQFSDDFTKSSILGLGVSSTGFVSQVAADAGVTADEVSMMTAALAIDITSSGGTINDLSLIKTQAFNFGGSLTVDNLYGVRVKDGISPLATNAYGISVEDAGADNFLAKSLTIGGTTKQTTNNEIALEIDTAKSIRLGRATTAQRTGFTDLAGLVVYDTDLNKFYGNDGSTWIELGQSSSTTWQQETPSGLINGSNVSFTLTNTPLQAMSLNLSLNGLVLRQGMDYTISGNTITMTTAPALGQTLWAIYTY